jgi:hypothetical protein
VRRRAEIALNFLHQIWVEPGNRVVQSHEHFHNQHGVDGVLAALGNLARGRPGEDRARSTASTQLGSCPPVRGGKKAFKLFLQLSRHAGSSRWRDTFRNE